MTIRIHHLATLMLCLMLSYGLAPTERYIIYPKEDLSHPKREQFTEELTELAGPQGNVYTSIRRPGSKLQVIRFWCADLTATAYNKLRIDERVLDIMVNKVIAELFTANESSNGNGTHLFRPTSEMTPPNSSANKNNMAYATQTPPVPAELRALSQPAGSGSISHYPNYVYPVGGRPTYIYHVELGINWEHFDFRYRHVEWLYTQSARAAGAAQMTAVREGGGHSTCTASKAVGKLYGASKSATLVVVKMPDLEQSSIREVLDTVIDDIHDKGREGKSVVSISWGIPVPSDRRSLIVAENTLRAQCFELLFMNVVIVCAAGNAAQERAPGGAFRSTVDTIPALFSYDTPPRWLTKFFVVGNSYINGLRYPDSQSLADIRLPYGQLYAPGVEVMCASNESQTAYKIWTGTSFSAPLVAGVIADLLSTGQFVPGSPFWWKRRGGKNVVWNRVTDAQNPPVSGNGNATLLNYTSPVFATTAFDNEHLDVSTE